MGLAEAHVATTTADAPVPQPPDNAADDVLEQARLALAQSGKGESCAELLSGPNRALALQLVALWPCRGQHWTLERAHLCDEPPAIAEPVPFEFTHVDSDAAPSTWIAKRETAALRRVAVYMMRHPGLRLQLSGYAENLDPLHLTTERGLRGRWCFQPALAQARATLARTALLNIVMREGDARTRAVYADEDPSEGAVDCERCWEEACDGILAEQPAVGRLCVARGRWHRRGSETPRCVRIAVRSFVAAVEESGTRGAAVRTLASATLAALASGATS